MAHPFFDSSTYPWHRKDARAFHEALYKAIFNGPAIDGLYISCGPNLVHLTMQRADSMWREALDTLGSAGLIKELGDRLRATPHVGVHQALAIVEKAIEPLSEPGIASDTIFVNRTNAREALGKLGHGGPASVLLVRGGSTSGKTWTRHIVKEQADSLGHECIYLFDATMPNPEAAVDTIFAAMGAKVPAKLTSQPAWYQKACTALQREATKKKRRYWIVVDDLGEKADGPLLDEDVRQLFETMAVNMLNPAFAQHFRLILIDYPDKTMPTKWKGSWLEDRPTEVEVQFEAVAEFIQRWLVRKKDKVLAKDDAEKFAKDLITRVDAPAADERRPRLERIHDELALVLPTL